MDSASSRTAFVPTLRPLSCLALVLFATTGVARADFEAGVAAARAGDYEAARREWRPLAEAGHRDAQYNLGLLYENGLGVARDATAAAAWYRKAAEQDDREAQAMLAEMYAKGLGVARDDAEALVWYRRAAERGHAAAQYNIGLFYALGRATEPDVVEAYAWLTVAAENGAPPSTLRDTLEKHMSEASLARARELADDVRKRCKLD
jgi:TPR repeat protein